MYKDNYIKQRKVINVRAYDLMGNEIDLGKE